MCKDYFIVFSLDFNVSIIPIHNIVFSIVKFAMSERVCLGIGFIVLSKISQLIFFFFYFITDYLSKNTEGLSEV